MKFRSLTLLLVAFAALSLVGCAGQKKLEKEVEALRMQVNTLSSDISQLDAQQRDLEQMAKGQTEEVVMVGADTTVVAEIAPVKGGAAGKDIYRTVNRCSTILSIAHYCLWLYPLLSGKG